MNNLSHLEIARIVEYGKAEGFIDMFGVALEELATKRNKSKVFNDPL